MNFSDLGIIITRRPHSDHSHILAILTAEHGLYYGLVRSTKSTRPYCEPGIIHKVVWQARLSEHLGTWTIDPFINTVPAVLGNNLFLSLLNSACDLISLCLNERESCPNLYACFSNMLVNIVENNSEVLTSYCLLECEIVKLMGLPLHFNQCAVTGQNTDLAYVSPRSGKAVSKDAARGYENKLLILPDFLQNRSEVLTANHQDIIDALTISDYFLKRYVLGMNHKSMPHSRCHLIDILRNYIGSHD